MQNQSLLDNSLQSHESAVPRGVMSQLTLDQQHSSRSQSLSDRKSRLLAGVRYNKKQQQLMLSDVGANMMHLNVCL